MLGYRCTRISETSFNRFPIRGNIIFGPTPSFVLRPSLSLGNSPNTDFFVEETDYSLLRDIF